MLKVAGFSGSLVASGGEENQQLIGNAEYQGPEIIMNQGFTQSADVWSFGCLLYFLVAGRSPFSDSNAMRMNMKIRQGKFEFGEGWSGVSSSLQDLISQLLRTDSTTRLSAAQILEHSWMKVSLSQIFALLEVSLSQGPCGSAPLAARKFMSDV